MKLSSLALAVSLVANIKTSTAFANSNINLHPYAAGTRTTTRIFQLDEAASSSEITTPNVDEIPTIEFPPPLTKVENYQRAAKFWSSAIPIVLSYYSKSAELQVKQAFTGVSLTEAEEQIIWNEQHRKGALELADIISSLKGFYVKTAQIIASRQDLFPAEYTDALSDFTDNVDPLPVSLIKAVVVKELLNRGEKFEDVFSEFDDTPVGAASVAQVHRAVLTEKYGGKEVAVKVQRPSIESKLMGDIANLKALAKTFRESDALPLDYYTVFCELESQLQDEFDFVAEAVAMDRIHACVTRDANGLPCESPIVLPRPVPGLVSKRVLVMDYLKGVPLSRAAEEMLKRGIDPDSPEAQIFGRRLLRALTDVFGRCILETGFFHADPHPGNIFVLDDGRVGLIDFGQVKQISGRARETLAKVMIALDDRESDTNPADLDTIGNLALELGVELNDGSQREAPAAVAMWLFDGSVETLPGGYDKGELSPNSPVKELKSFPQDLVLVGRSTILIKGLSSRLNVPWSLSKEWAPTARRVLEGNRAVKSEKKQDLKIRMRDVVILLNSWGKGKASRAVTKLPPPLRKRVAAAALKIQKRKEAKRAESQK